MSEEKKQNDSEHYQIIDYQNCIKESDVEKFERHFYELDKFRFKILKAIVDIFDWYGNGEIGEPIALELLFDLKKKVQKKINLVEIEIPEIADVEFVLLGELEKGGTILISKDFDHTSKIQHDRKEAVKEWQRRLNDNLSLSLGELLFDLENLISKIENFGTYSDIRDWYPQLKKENKRAQKGTKSNHDKLSVANEWMDPLVKKILSVKPIIDSEKANKRVGLILEKEYKGFIRNFPEPKTPFVSGGTITKKSVALAIKFIFENRHNDEIKDYTAITKRYNHLDWR